MSIQRELLGDAALEAALHPLAHLFVKMLLALVDWLSDVWTPSVPAAALPLPPRPHTPRPPPPPSYTPTPAAASAAAMRTEGVCSLTAVGVAATVGLAAAAWMAHSARGSGHGCVPSRRRVMPQAKTGALTRA